MAIFSYQAKNFQGKVVRGELDAANMNEARLKIRAQKLIVLNVVPKSREGAGQIHIGFLQSHKVKPKELQIFTRQFAVLIGAGVPVVQSLEAMLGGGKTPAMSNALKRIVVDVEKGKRLADAFGAHPNVFDRLYINLVRAGEEGGVLDEVLNRLANYIERTVKLRRKVMGALWYPSMIVVVAFLIISGILIFVIPQFAEMFGQMGQELPALTLYVMKLSEKFKNNWLYILGILVALPFMLKSYYNTDDGRRVLDAIIIDTPLFGGLIQKASIAKFSRTLSTLLTAGVRIIDSLEIAASTSGNSVIEGVINKSKDSVAKGRTLSEPLASSKFIPNMVTQMISVGEQTGNLDLMLSKVADFYEDEVETTSEALTSLIEPILMVVLGGVIAFLVVAMYLPIFNIANVVGG